MPRQTYGGNDRSIGALLEAGSRVLAEDCARLDCELLLAHVLDCRRTYLYAHPELQVSEAFATRFMVLLERRRGGEPIAYITGTREFWSMELAVNRATLVPRPETELLVELALESPRATATQVLDMGTGSGAIALALACERPDCQITGVDIDESALEVARGNAARLGLSNVVFLRGNWFEGLAGRRYGMIVSNPPYISEIDPCLDLELRHEPRSALASGREGLDALRVLAAGAPGCLLAGAWMLCEHGATQGGAVRELFASAGFGRIETRRDLAGLERVTLGNWSGALT